MKKSLRHYIAIPLRRGTRNESGRVDVEYITAGSLCSQEATMIVNILYCNLLNGCSLIFSQHLLLVASCIFTRNQYSNLCLPPKYFFLMRLVLPWSHNEAHPPPKNVYHSTVLS